MTVNIYLHQTIKGPARQEGVGIYVLEAVTPQGAYTKTFKEKIEASENEAWMRVLGLALAHMIHPSDLNLYFDSQWLGAAVENWLPSWRERGYLSAKGQPIKNRDLWEEIGTALEKQNVTVKVGVSHSYRSWLINNAKTA